MTEILRELIEKQELCAIYTDANDTDKFSVGYILGIDKNSFLMEHIDQYGKADGISCNLIDFIFKVERDTLYCKNIEKLFKYLKQKRFAKLSLKNDVTMAVIDYA